MPQIDDTVVNAIAEELKGVSDVDVDISLVALLALDVITQEELDEVKKRLKERKSVQSELPKEPLINQA